MADCPASSATRLNTGVTETVDRSIDIEQVAWADPRAIALRDAMDTEIQPRYAGRDTDPVLVAAALAVDPTDIVATLLLISDGTPVGHAALRRLGDEWEVKRVVIDGSRRGAGLGRRLMTELETIARDGGASRLILQTGDRQPEAVALYRKLGYREIASYEPYATAIPFSRCFEKSLEN